MLLPYVTPVVASTLVFVVVFASDNGMANWVLVAGRHRPQPTSRRSTGGGRSQSGRSCPGSPIATMVNWKWIGYNALLYLAAMQSIPQGRLRGGRGRRRRPVAPVVADHRADDPAGRDLHRGALDHRRPAAVHRADALRRRTRSRPAAAPDGEWQTIAQLIYKVGWKDLDLGYAAAMSWALFLIIVIVAIVNALVTNRLGGGRK